MIPGRMGRPAGEPMVSAHVKAVRKLLDVRSERPQSPCERGDTVAFLDAQLAGAGDPQIAAMGGHRREGRQLVDHGRHVGRRQRQGPQSAVANAHPAAGL